MRHERLAMAAVALALGACVPNRASLEFTKLCMPPAPSDTGACEYPPQCEFFLADGRPFVDLAATGGTFFMPVEMRNNLFENEDQSSNRPNTANLVIEKWRLDYEGAYSASDVDVGVAIGMAAGEIASPLVALIPPSVGAQMAASLAGGQGEVTISLHAVVRTLDGGTFVAGPFTVPVDVCVGCLSQAALECSPGVEPIGACPQNGQTSTRLCPDAG